MTSIHRRPCLLCSAATTWLESRKSRNQSWFGPKRPKDSDFGHSEGKMASCRQVRFEVGWHRDLDLYQEVNSDELVFRANLPFSEAVTKSPWLHVYGHDAQSRVASCYMISAGQASIVNVHRYHCFTVLSTLSSFQFSHSSTLLETSSNVQNEPLTNNVSDLPFMLRLKH